MAVIDQSLKWRKHPEDFEPAQRKILLALSNKQWRWRTLESLQKATRLPSGDLAPGLRDLMEDGVVRGSIGRGKGPRKPIYGLVERVGDARSRWKKKWPY